jgi:hypothetical protein
MVGIVLAMTLQVLPSSGLEWSAPAADPVAASLRLPEPLLAPLPQADDDPGWLFDFFGIWEQTELDKVNYDVVRAQFGMKNSTKLGDIDLEDNDRRRVGGGIRIGGEAFSVAASVYQERLQLDDVFYMPGFRLGIEGMPRLTGDDDLQWIGDYGADVAYAVGDGDVMFRDQSAGTDFPVDGTLRYWSSRYWLGTGIRWRGFFVTVGGMGDVLSGAINLDLDDDIEFEAGNYAGYGRVGYRAGEVPIVASGMVMVGQQTGFAVELGLRF